ncbi:type I pullulanase [Peribacillus sp. SCS-26]|uniref:type I pullulanase n=1 Tax=Paraperibacillus marinus TaxID=3115295 RepID=UPI003905D78B
MENSRPFLAYLDAEDLVTILVPHGGNKMKAGTFYLTAENEDRIELSVKETLQLEEQEKYVCKPASEVHIGTQYDVWDSEGHHAKLQAGAIIRTEKFDEMFYYSGEDLGAGYTMDKTVFKVWAPTAADVKVMIYEEDGRPFQEEPCVRGDKGVWISEVPGNLEGLHYKYKVLINDKWEEAVDPYAKAVGLNGKSGVIVDLSKTAVKRPEMAPFPNATDAIIYEAHIRDFSIHPDSGITRKGTYRGFGEGGTISASGKKTGLDYIEELGITHVELQPFNDFEGISETEPLKEYNWGYNPLHFNAPEGSFSSDPEDPYARIKELKEMIAALQERNIRVIMDVVYNHVYERETSQFEKLVPGYYFRHDEFGQPSNGTGVGNDFASERKMARKFILDSVKYWLKEYGINGFRFDLMGILDVETMNEVRRAAHDHDESTIILGEGWDLNTPLHPGAKATLKNSGKMPRIAHFNDWFRDTVKGSTFNIYDRGFILGSTGKTEALAQLIRASINMGKDSPGLFNEPDQTINYIESHDNHTLWDKLSLCSPEESADVRMSRHRLGTAIVLLSQGIPFLHSGQEFYRTKNNVENSYKSPDQINWLDWSRRDRFQENVEYVKGLIAIRKKYPAFRLSSASEIQNHCSILYRDAHTLIYCLDDSDSKAVVVLYNGDEEKEISADMAGEWNLLSDGIQAGLEPIEKLDGLSFTAAPLRAYVFIQQ